ncbi:MAG TPA: TrmH family RNA methyltransferase [Gammaproteobacteria bacterium]
MTRLSLPFSAAGGGHNPGTPVLIDSLLHPQAALIRALLTRSRQKVGNSLILIDDEENIVRAIYSGVVIRSIVRSCDTTIPDYLRRRLPPDVQSYEIAKRTCKKLFENDKVSRIFAIADAPQPQSLNALLAARRDIVVLDGISIAGNIGAIIRTSSAMGIGGIVLVNAESTDIFDRRVIRASRGYLFALPVIAATAGELIRFCALRGMPIVVTLPRAGRAVSEISLLPHPLAIVYGREKTGCSQMLIDAATLHVEILTNPAVESLNVAAAAAITLYCRYNFNRSRESC